MGLLTSHVHASEPVTDEVYPFAVETRTAADYNPSTSINYKYVHTLEGSVLLPPPVTSIRSPPGKGSSYHNDKDPYVDSLLSYSTYIHNHLSDIVRVTPGLNSDLQFRVGCTTYKSVADRVPTLNDMVDINKLNIKNSDELISILGSVVRAQRNHIRELKALLISIDGEQIACWRK